MPNFDKMERRIKCVLMAAIQKEQRTGGHLAKEQEALRVEKSHSHSSLQMESSHAKLARGSLQSIVEKMEVSQTIQLVMTLYFK